MANDPITFMGAVDIPPIEAAAVGRPRRFSVRAYTGGELRIARYSHPVVVDLAGAKFPERPITANLFHDTTRIVGHIERHETDGRTLILHGVVSGTGPGAQEFVGNFEGGYPWQASIEAQPLVPPERIPSGETVQVNGREFRGPIQVARQTELCGVAFLPRGADPDTSVTIFAKSLPQGSKTMSEITHPDSETIIATERNRVARIEAAYSTATFETDAVRKRAAKLRATAIHGDVSFEAFTDGLQELLRDDRQLGTIRAERPRGPMIHAGGGTASHNDIIAGAWYARLGREDLGEKILGAQTMQRARDLRATSTVGIYEAAYRLEGRDAPSNTAEMIQAAGGLSTISVAGILSNVAGKLLLDAYTAFPSVARMIAKRLSASDFKTQTGYRLTGDTVLKELPKGGEITSGTLGEQSYTFKVDTFARMITLDRRDIIDDDLSAFSTVPAMLGRGAAVAVEEAFWTLVLANTSSFFGAGNSNYISGGTSVLALTGLGLAVAKMRQMTDADGKPVLVVPKYLVVPPELESTADSLYASTNILATGTTDAQAPAGNPYQGKYQPLVVPHLSNSTFSGYSTTAWYLFGSPGDVAAFGVAYLNNQEGPVVEQVDLGATQLGLGFRAYLDFGVCQIDHRGGVMSAGA